MCVAGLEGAGRGFVDGMRADAVARRRQDLHGQHGRLGLPRGQGRQGRPQVRRLPIVTISQ